LETVNTSKNGASSDGGRYRFEEIEVDPSNRTCARDGMTLPVSGKVFDILLTFVENPGRLLFKDELLERVWPNEFVEEGNLARNVSTLRKALGDNGKDHKYIVTVPGHGYRFAAEVSTVKPAPLTAVAGDHSVYETDDAGPIGAGWPLLRSRKLFWTGAALVLLFTAAWFGKDRLFSPSPTVKTIAVLPLKGIDPNDNYLGFGIADAVIRRLSSSGQVTVRPASAVLHYLNQETDTLAAARELNTDAILEGNVQRSGSRLRVNVNLLKSADGSSIWNDKFELEANDLFQVEDQVAQQVAERLRIRLGNGSNFAARKDPSSQLANEWYMKGLFSLDQRGFDHDDMGHMLDTIDFFKQSIEIDPNSALAHGKLAFSYAWMAGFVDPGDAKWADLTREEIGICEKLDPNLADSHVANALLFWSAYGNYQIEPAIKELRLAKQLDPNFTGAADLTALYAHAGLDRQAEDELHRAISIDPTSRALKDLQWILPYMRNDTDGWRSALPARAELDDQYLAPWYYLHSGGLDRAKVSLDQQLSKMPTDQGLRIRQQLLFALQGNFDQIGAVIPDAIAKTERNENYHHKTLDVACIYALAGNATEALKWLRVTANTGFPNYPLFAREPFLDRIRQSPEFIQFLAEQKAQWEHFEQEFPVE